MPESLSSAEAQPARTRLTDGLEALGLDLSAEAVTQLLDFVALLGRWNRAFNLTSVRDPAQMITRHLLDSLSIAPALRGRRIVDVGTGGGLPGIPLAIACPERQFTLLDSNGKKTRFVTQAAAELGLHNVEVVKARAAEYHPPAPFDCVISRAFASVGELAQQAGHLCAEDGYILAMKGVYPMAELQSLPADFTVTEVVPLQVPSLDGERHLVVMRRAGSEVQ